MKRPRRQHVVAEINITPFTDVILVLLVIFMITTPLISEHTIAVNLPKAKSGSKTQSARAVSSATVTVTSKGVLYLNGQLVSREDLREQIKALFAGNPDISVRIRGDKKAVFKDIVAVLDILTELGIPKLNIAATAVSEE